MARFLAISLIFSVFSQCSERGNPFAQGEDDIHDFLTLAKSLQYNEADSSILYAKSALRLSLELNNEEGIAESCLIIGEKYLQKGVFDQANKYLIQSLQVLRELEISFSLGKAYNLLGRVYQYSGQSLLAIQHYQLALQTFSQLDDPVGLAETYGNLGHWNEKELHYDSAIYYQNKARDLYIQLNDSMGLAHIYDFIGSIYEDLSYFEDAKKNFELAYEINTSLKNESEALINLNNLGDVARKTNQLAKAEDISLEVLQKAKDLDELYQLRSAYRDLAKIYRLTQQDRLSFSYLDSAYDLSGTIYSQEIANAIAERKLLYDISEKDQEIQLLKKDREVNRLYRIGLIGISLLILGLVLLLYLQLSIRFKKNKKLLEAERKLAIVNEQRLTTELNFKKLQEEKLQQELENTSKELTTNALHIIQKNEFLDSLKSELKKIKKVKDEGTQKQVQKIIKSIDYNFSSDDDWQEFESVFQKVHSAFFLKLRESVPDLTPTEIRLCAMLRLNLHSKDIATIMGISQDSLRIARYRLRKKLGIDKGANLYSYIMNVC